MKNLKNYSDFIWNRFHNKMTSAKVSRILQPGIFVFSSILMIGFGNASYGQFTNLNGLPIAYWDFESNASRTVLETTVDQAINSGFAFNGKVGGVTTSTCAGTGRGTYYGGAAVGTTAGAALSAGGWSNSTTAAGSTTYYQFSLNTTGFSGISFMFDLYSQGTAADYPLSAYSYSTDGGTTWATYSGNLSTRNTWNGWTISLPASCDNNANVKIRIAGYYGTNLNNCANATGTLRIDNFQVMATALVANAGTKNSLNELMIYTGCTSGATGSLWLRFNTFTVNSGATLNLSGSDIYVGGSTTAGAVNVLSGGTLDCGAVTSRTLLSVSGYLGTVTINSGANIIVRSPDGITNAGTLAGNIQTTSRNYNAGGNYTYQNSSSSSYSQVTGTGLPTALTGNLIINNPSSVNLSVTTAVNNPGTLFMTSGNLILNANNVTAQNLTGGSASSYVKTNSTGVLTRPESGANTLFPVGNSAYNPAEITNLGTSDSYSVRVIDNVTQDGTGVGTTIVNPTVKRTWMISEGVVGGSDVTLRLSWNGAGEEINGFNVANSAYMAHYSTAWDNWGGTVNASFAQKSSISTFSPFTVMSNSTLPVELVSLEAICSGIDVNVKWITASEHNSSIYRVERSEDGVNWESIGDVAAAGNSTEILEYVYTDKNAARSKGYYRIIQVDLDGQYKVYGPASLNCDQQSTEHRVYPNPSNGTFMLELNDVAHASNSFNIEIKDGQGKIVYGEEYNTESGSGQFIIGLPEIAPGMYYLTISSKEANTQTIKLVFR